MSLFEFLADNQAFVTIIVVAGVIGWVLTTWLRVRHGYPLEGGWGQAVYPKASAAPDEVVRLTSLVEQQTATMEKMGARLATMERIVTDQPSLLAQEIDRLAIGGEDARR